jgi:hypothetical protein
MTRRLITAFMAVALVLVQAQASFAQMTLLGAGGGSSAPAVSTMSIVNTDVQDFNSAAGTHPVDVPAATGGNAGILIQIDWDTNSVPSAAPAGGGTWTAYTGCTFSATKRVTVYYNTNLTNGNTAITLDPFGSSKTTSIYYEVSGMNASPEDVCNSVVSNSGAQQQTTILTNTATGMAVYVVMNGATSAASYDLTDNWASQLDSTGVTNKAASAGVILNGRGQFVGRSTNASAGSTHNNLVFTFKSAVNQAAPSGNLVSGVIDWMGGSDTNAMTLTIAGASSHGLGAIQTNAGTANEISTTQTHSLVVQQTANGAQYTSSSMTQSQRVDMGDEANNNTTWSVPATSKGVVSFWYYTGANEASMAQTRVNPIVISGVGNGDYASVQHLHPANQANPPQFVLEVLSGAANTPVNAAINSWYQIVVCYNAGGTHEGYVFDAGGSQILHQTGAANGSVNTLNFSTGNLHSNGGLGEAGNYKYIGPIVYNFTAAAACPTMP